YDQISFSLILKKLECFQTNSQYSKEPDECCYGYFPNPIRRSLISSYYETDSRCPKKAVVLITKKYRHICVEPGKDWVEKIINIQLIANKNTINK
uniref:C-C motif chemokine n=1 Tax=Cyprinodon variegatus TaxID=28743 RepID=A0A3Q2GJV7_CYPVA